MRKLVPDRIAFGATAAVLLIIPSLALAQPPAVTPPAPIMPPQLPPTHVVDLMTQDGIAAFGTKWKIADVKIVEVAAIQGAMPKYKTTYGIEPMAGAKGFDDSKWETIDAKDLAARRTGGHVSFMWYRAHFTMPAKLGNFDLDKPAVAVLNVLVDDYAEVWVNGDVPRKAGYPAPATIQGHNIPNRVVLGTAVKAGDTFEVAVFGINGPISVAPANTVWFRQAKMEFFR
jgi:gluconolactonase